MTVVTVGMIIGVKIKAKKANSSSTTSEAAAPLNTADVTSIADHGSVKGEAGNNDNVV